MEIEELIKEKIISKLCEFREEKMNLSLQNEVEIVQQCMDIVEEGFKVDEETEEIN